ncbi:lipoprotein-releasing ABC transporter permease subunit LolE [Candidatus Erwinia haradaeae]|uniref:Lipoprotein-releasing system transmembrane protein LolE n=1 Tax=Candidatus Erwinia haradaeae TaxID=1922217 RepID=A0A451DAI0_9GAMM|nr:lipoprotein-releasing ABC transporter permease subunit LolE [Candidatus Erwinia haradaeae]VFP83296.1 Lipoprotein-releasing system transmembrane protein LolE [Candidatus Erwinia haradaeae]
MTLSLSCFIGFRFSYGRSRRGMLSLIAVISTLGIAISIAVLIISLSAMNGFERELNQRVLAVVPHCEIEPVDQNWLQWKTALQIIEMVPGVAAAAPYITFTGLLESDSHKLAALQVKGVDTCLERRISSLSSYLQGSDWEKFLPGQSQVLLGKGVTERLHVNLGDWITMIVPYQNMEHKLSKPKYVRLQVTGILNFGGIRDYSLAYIPIIDAQKLLKIGNNITGIAIKAHQPFEAESLARQVGDRIDASVFLRSWISTYGYMYHDVQRIRTIIYLAIVLVIGVACFNIVSTLMMAVKDKCFEIAILRTLGAGDGLIRAIFMWYGVLLGGVVGSIIGISMGVLLSLKITSIMHVLEHLTGCRVLSGEIYFIDFLPAELQWFDVLMVFMASVALSLVATWYPARQAIRLQPAQVLSRQ